MQKKVSRKPRQPKHRTNMKNIKDSFSYEVKMSKRKGKGVRWLVIERPTGSIITEEIFEDKAHKVADHQNKYKQWANQGGVVKHLTMGKI
mgnify:FL=1|jgi:hypothetical protein|tara:strand:+ start:121 stop:390 length:270 start_codon:yes stop_codon:yes gene_type:complete